MYFQRTRANEPPHSHAFNLFIKQIVLQMIKIIKIPWCVSNSFFEPDSLTDPSLMK